MRESGHENEYIAARLEDQEVRRHKFGNSATMQEPNIKNGCGGLRDYQNLLWMSFFKHRTRSLEEIQEKGMISTREVKQLATAYSFLLRVRNELHYIANRPADILPKTLQPSVAFNLGYHERSAGERLEVFMGRFYRHTRNIDLITREVERRLALLPQPPSRMRFCAAAPHFRRGEKARRRRRSRPSTDFDTRRANCYPPRPPFSATARGG